MNCTRHRRPNCLESVCRREHENRESNTTSTDTSSDLANPVSPLHQAVYGGSFYGSTSSDSDCGSPNSSSSYDSGSSSSYDSGSSSSSDCGSY